MKLRYSHVSLFKWLQLFYLSDVALRMEDDDVEFGRKETGQRDGSAQTDGDAHTGDPQRQMTGRTVNKNNKNKCGSKCGSIY